jgi:hypothetical protein
VRSRRSSRLIATAFTVLAASSGLVAVVLALVVQRGSLGQDGAVAGWLMPAAAALVVGGVTWLLLGEIPRRDMQAPPSEPVQTCPDCEREVAEDWRLCPWCGYRSQRRDRPDATTGAGHGER